MFIKFRRLEGGIILVDPLKVAAIESRTDRVRKRRGRRPRRCCTIHFGSDYGTNVRGSIVATRRKVNAAIEAAMREVLNKSNRLLKSLPQAGLKRLTDAIKQGPTA